MISAFASISGKKGEIVQGKLEDNDGDFIY